MAVIFKTELETLKDISARVKMVRLSQNLTQELLAQRSGVSFGSVKRFETSGEISLRSLIKIAYVLETVHQFDSLFQQEQEIQSLEQLKKLSIHRKRGRRNA